MQSGIAVRVAPALFAVSTVAVLPHALAADPTFFISPRIHGYEEVPTRSNPAVGEFRAIVNRDGTAIDYQLTYSGFLTPVREAHIHLGTRRVNGGVMVFLCSNTGNAPPNTPACPATEGTVTGTLVAASVVGPAEQGIAPGALDKVLAAMRVRAGYVNIHTEQVPAGEIRDQVVPAFFGNGANGQGGTESPADE